MLAGDACEAAGAMPGASKILEPLEAFWAAALPRYQDVAREGWPDDERACRIGGEHGRIHRAELPRRAAELLLERGADAKSRASLLDRIDGAMAKLPAEHLQALPSKQSCD